MTSLIRPISKGKLIETGSVKSKTTGSTIWLSGEYDCEGTCIAAGESLLKFALIGCGKSGHSYATIINNHPKTDLAAVVDTNPEAARAFGASFGCKSYTSVDEYLASNKFADCAILCAYPSENIRNCLQADAAEDPCPLRAAVCPRFRFGRKNDRRLPHLRRPSHDGVEVPVCARRHPCPGPDSGRDPGAGPGIQGGFSRHRGHAEPLEHRSRT